MVSFEDFLAKLDRQWLSLVLTMYYRKWGFKQLAVAIVICFLCSSLFILYNLVFKVELLPWYPNVERWCDYEEVPDYLERPGPDEVTVVTMFLDLGVFKKGEEMFAYHSPYKYRRWMRVFGKMANRVVAYFEKDADIEYFKDIRSCFPEKMTKIIKLHREELDAFKNLNEITQIYHRPSYPKHFPNTVYPEYSCAMSAKYDVLQTSCIMNYFKTPFFAWVDIGLFRNLDGTDFEPFKLITPDKFNVETIGFTQAWPHDPVLTPSVVMKNKIVWVSGAMILAERSRMLNFTKDYKNTVLDLLRDGLSNTDQEVIYSMYTVHKRKQRFIKIKTYLCHEGQLGLSGADKRYFCLGYVCKNAWERLVPHIIQHQRKRPLAHKVSF